MVEIKNYTQQNNEANESFAQRLQDSINKELNKLVLERKTDFNTSVQIVSNNGIQVATVVFESKS